MYNLFGVSKNPQNFQQKNHSKLLPTNKQNGIMNP